MVAVYKEWLTDGEAQQDRDRLFPWHRHAPITERHQHPKRDLYTGVIYKSRPASSEGLELTLAAIYKAMGDTQQAGDPCPSFQAALYATSWISRLYSDVSNSGGHWIEPHVVSNPDGEIVFTWWRGNRMLTIYCSEDTAEYLESWGVRIRSEMADGNADLPATYRALWSRLLRG